MDAGDRVCCSLEECLLSVCESLGPVHSTQGEEGKTAKGMPLKSRWFASYLLYWAEKIY